MEGRRRRRRRRRLLPFPAVLLPAPPLPEALVAPLRATLGTRAHFPSNPARLRLHAREVVVFRSDVAARLRGAALLPPNSGHGGGGAAGGGSTGASATFEHAALTLLQQAHLCPLPLDAAPVSWDADGGLRLYPLPHALVLAGGGRGGGRGAARGCDASFEGVECFDPGSFSKSGSFRGYSPRMGASRAAARCRRGRSGEEKREGENKFPSLFFSFKSFQTFFFFLLQFVTPYLN